MKEKLKNKRVVYTILGIISLLLVVVAITYAYWLITKNQTGKNVISSACLDISLIDEKNDITLANQFPISDEEGQKLVPYEFKVSNNCNTEIEYRIALEMLGNESDMITSNGIKISLNNNMGVLDTFNEITPTIEDAYESRTIGYGTLAAKGSEEDTDSYELRIWIDKDADESEMKKTFRSKITVSTAQDFNSVYKEGTLAYDIVSRYGGPSEVIDLSGNYEIINTGLSVLVDFGFGGKNGDNITIKTETGEMDVTGNVKQASFYNENDWNEEKQEFEPAYGKYTLINSYYALSGIDWHDYINSGGNVERGSGTLIMSAKSYNTKAGTGLYKTEDDLGTSYYYRGNVENNYLKLYHGQEYVEDIIPAQEAEEAYKPINISSDLNAEIAAIYSTMHFTSKEFCEEIASGGLWESCEKQEEITELYFPTDTTDESMLTIGYLTEEECTMAGASIDWTTCEKRELKEATSEIDNSYYKDVYTYWRIVRVNGDGTIRLIYDGENLYENGVKHSAVANSSLNTWYEKNIKDTYLEQYIADSIFCEDKESFESDFVVDEYNNFLYDYTYLGSYRINSKSPSLKCSKKADRLSVNNELGNQSLTYPISLITADEAAMAGSLTENNAETYLAIGYSFKSLTPNEKKYEYGCTSYADADQQLCGNYGYYANISKYSINADGTLGTSTAQNRPVINLVADVLFTGSGTITDPYVIGK